MNLPAKEKLDQLKDLISLAQKTLLGVGVWILFCYCLSEQIRPDDLSLGDAMVLIMIALGFGVVMTVGIGYGIIAALAPIKLSIALSNAAKKDNKLSLPTVLQGKFMTSVSAVLLLLLCLLILVGEYSDTASDMKVTQTVTCFVVIGMLLLVIFFVRREGNELRSHTWNLALGTLAIVTPIVTLHPAAMNITMTALGIRSAPGSLIVFNPADYQGIEELLTQSGLKVHFCKLPKSGKWATTDARVVWHGVGATSFVSFLDRPSAGRYTVATSVPKANLQVIHPEHWTFNCDNTLSGKAAAP